MVPRFEGALELSHDHSDRATQIIFIRWYAENSRCRIGTLSAVKTVQAEVWDFTQMYEERITVRCQERQSMFSER